MGAGVVVAAGVVLAAVEGAALRRDVRRGVLTGLLPGGLVVAGLVHAALVGGAGAGGAFGRGRGGVRRGVLVGLDPELGVGVQRQLAGEREVGGGLSADRGGLLGGGLLGVRAGAGARRGGGLGLLGRGRELGLQLRLACLGDRLHRGEHAAVAGAAAEVAAERLARLDVAGPVVALQQVVHGHGEAGVQ
ncbi:hypothetical protein GCM10025734_34680 [Kitasatospora paranensis]